MLEPHEKTNTKNNAPSKEQVIALIDKFFEMPPFAGFYRGKLNNGDDTVQFVVENPTGSSYHIFELNKIVAMLLLNYPPDASPGCAFIALSAFLIRLRLITELGVDNAKDISMLETIETFDLAQRYAKKETPANDESEFENFRKDVLYRVKKRNDVMVRRKHTTSNSKTSIASLTIALMEWRFRRPDEEPTIYGLSTIIG